MSYRPVGIYALLLLALLFGTAGAVEITHPVEEAPHTGHSHHAHAELSYHAPPPCETGGDHSHFCNHCQQSAPVFFYATSRPFTPERAAVQAGVQQPCFSVLLECLTRAPPSSA